MKGFVCVLAVLVAAVCVQGAPSEEMKKYFEECKREVGFTDEKFKGSPNFDDPKFKCLNACMAKKRGSLENGKVSAEKEIEYSVKYIPNVDDSMKEKITQCVKTANEKTDECDVAMELHKCYLEKLKNLHMQH